MRPLLITLTCLVLATLSAKADPYPNWEPEVRRAVAVDPTVDREALLAVSRARRAAEWARDAGRREELAKGGGGSSTGSKAAELEHKISEIEAEPSAEKRKEFLGVSDAQIEARRQEERIQEIEQKIDAIESQRRLEELTRGLKKF